MYSVYELINIPFTFILSLIVLPELFYSEDNIEQLIIKLKPTDSSSSEIERFSESSDSSDSDQP